MRFTHAITRMPGIDFDQGITTSQEGAPDYSRIIAQHQAYTYTLAKLGMQVIMLPPLVGFPDSYFTEDVAVVTARVAVITIPGAASRRGEVSSIEQALRTFRPVEHIQPPGTMEGGDVLMVEDHFFIGISERTNAEGAQQLGAILAGHGYSWTAVPVSAGLHFKSSVNYAGNKTLLVTSEFASHPALEGYAKIILEPNEEYAANTLFVNDTLLTPRGYTHAYQQLTDLGFPIVEMDVSEVRKMDGGLTCMSLRL